MINMSPRKEFPHSEKRVEPKVADEGSVHREPQEEESHLTVRHRRMEQEEARDWSQEIVELRAENRALREQMARGKFSASSSASTPPTTQVTRRAIR